MKERPILFSAPMVNAILDGTKTQTRRMFKVQPMSCVTDICLIQDKWHFKLQGCKNFVRYDDSVKCPYGKPGDQLWVRETFFINHYLYAQKTPKYKPQDIEEYDICFKADETDSEILNEARWKPSIHMPRWASRIQLEITDIRVERLHDISEEDAYQEGIYHADIHLEEHEQGACDKYKFLKLWDQIYGKNSTDQNPWVWVIEFKRIVP